MSSITVLCPNGRRQNVKVTPNTSLLHVLEEVCKKQKFEANEHELKHYRRTLDLSLTVRYANLPNNTLLEMEKSAEKRLESNIKVGLQFECGQRVFGEFSANHSLYDILMNWKEKVESDLNDQSKQVIMTYMRKQIVGTDALKTTSLRQLGLTSGSAAFRLLYREADVVGNQAFVAKDLVRQLAKSVPVAVETVGNAIEDGMMADDSQEVVCMEEQNEQSRTVEHAGSVDCEQMDVEEEEEIQGVQLGREPEQQCTDCPAPAAELASAHLQKEEHVENTIIIGERDAMLFNLDDIDPISHDDLPDDFFELNITQVKYLMKDLVRKRQELDDLPLETHQMREASQLTLLNKYKKCYLRIQFPDRLVLQGTFRPIETVSCVMDFVRTFLNDSIPFYLFTAPPKCQLDPHARLFELGLVPAAIVHFGSEHAAEHYLKPDLMHKVSTFRAASKSAFTCSDCSTASSENSSNKRPSKSANMSSKLNKVPRWFKPK